MRRPVRVLVGLAFGAALPTHVRADEWTLAHTPRFDLVSDAGSEAARAEASALEAFEAAIGPLIGPEPPGPPPATVVLMVQAGTFQPLRPRYQGRPVEVDGFVQAASDRRFVVARTNAHGALPGETVRHEYVHLLLSRRMALQPVWLAEGLADLLSDFQPMGADATVGGPRPAYLALLRTRELLPLENVLTARDDSSLYNQGEKRDVLYAQSWALAHSLVIGRVDGRERLGRYLQLLGDGMAAAPAFREALGEELESAERRLATYVRGEALGSLRVPLSTAPADVSARPMPAAEVHSLLGNLLLHSGRLDEAGRHLEAALTADPRWGPAHEALGHLAIRRGHLAKARSHIETALASGPPSAATLYRWADTLVREAGERGEVIAGEAEAEAVRVLEAAVALSPDFADACDLLARLRPHPRAARIALLEAAWARNPDRADLGITLAGLHLDVGDAGRAVNALTRARRVAREEHVQFVCDHLLGRLRASVGSTTEIDGQLVGLECPAGGALAFLVRHGRERLRLHAPTPVSVLLLDADGEPHERTLTCGTQSASVQARYRRGSGGGGDSDGTLLALTFTEAPPSRGR